MSFDAFETSIADGQPIRLYEFTRGAAVWRYASADRDIVRGINTYAALLGGITDDGIRQTGQASADLLKISARADLAPAQFFRGTPPSDSIEVTVWTMHYGDTEALLAWLGSIRSVRWPKLDRCEITCAPLSDALDMQGLRLGWERTCPHALYTAACGVDPTPWRVPATITAADGASITTVEAAGYADGNFTAGYVEWTPLAGVRERRGIESHAGGVLTLLGGADGLAVGTAVDLYPGCPQTVAGCQQFNNLDNSGAIPHLSGKSPFDGNNPF